VHSGSTTNTNTYNNSNVNSPRGTITTVVGSTNPTPIIVTTPNPTPVYTYNYGTYPTNYYGNYPTYYGGQYNSLSGNCYPLSGSTAAGNSVTWTSSASGGNGIYSYTWSGTDGLSGYGSNLSYTYYNPGTKVGNVTITSNGQSISIPCSQSVIVNGNYNYNNNYNYNYNNGYNNNYNNYSQLYVTCDANTTNAPVGVNVVWTSNVSGGNGVYSYSWSGTDTIYGSGSIVTAAYTQPGTKTASLTVYSNGQTASAQCNRSVSIGNGNYNYNNNNGNEIIAACAADATTVRTGTQVTWSVEATGSTGNFSYAWTGTDGLSGSTNSTATSYSTTGQKNASVIITSSDGKSTSKSCGTVTVRNGGNGNGGNGNGSATVTGSSDGSNLTGNAFFSLGNIPWGWVALLIILVLFGTVLYLLFNKNKI
jgi:hypothetical protein